MVITVPNIILSFPLRLQFYLIVYLLFTYAYHVVVFVPNESYAMYMHLVEHYHSKIIANLAAKGRLSCDHYVKTLCTTGRAHLIQYCNRLELVQTGYVLKMYANKDTADYQYWGCVDKV